MDAYIHSFLDLSNDFSGVSVPSLSDAFLDDSLIPSERLPSVVSIPDPIHEGFYPPFTLDEFKLILCNVKLESSPCMDKISFMVILHLPESSISLLLQILYAIFDVHLFSISSSSTLYQTYEITQ